MKILAVDRAGSYKSSAVRFCAGSVLYARLRPYLNKVIQPTFDGLCSGEFIVFRPHSQIVGDFLRYLLNSSSFVTFASHLKEGDRPRVDFDQIAEYEMALPPLLEQRRIVAEIEKQFTRLDEASQLLASQRKKLERYESAVLNSITHGAKATTVFFRDLLTSPLRNGHSAKIASAGIGIRAITLSAITEGDFAEVNTKITSADPKRVQDLWMQPDDFLFQRGNTAELVGLARLYQGPAGFAIFPDLVIRARTKDIVNRQYIEAVLHSPKTRNYL